MAKSTKPRKGSSNGYGRRRTGREECEHKNSKEAAAENKQQSWAVMKSILTCKHLQVEPPKHKQLPLQEDDSSTNITKRSSSKKMRCSGSLSLSLCNNTTTNPNPNPNKVIPEREKRPTPAPDPLQIAFQSNNNSPPDQHHLLFYRRKVSAASSSSSFSIISDQTGSSSTSRSRSSFVSTSVTSSSSLLSTASMNKRMTASASASGSHFKAKGLPFRKLSLSGCSECTTVAVDPVLAGLTRDPSLRSTISSCPQCGDIFMKPDLLQLHQATKHAVSELGPEDTSRNIVEIIFQSSWLKKEAPVCKIDRILKVHNTSRTVSRFEEYRDMIKGKAAAMATATTGTTGTSTSRLPTKKHPRCIADGNELLRFHCTTLMCSLGLHGSSNLCNSSPSCSVCGIIRDGFKTASSSGILTTATSGRAHDQADQLGCCSEDPAAASSSNSSIYNLSAGHQRIPRKAMLVCRVIAGRVKKAAQAQAQAVINDTPGLGLGLLEEYDSVAAVGGGPVYSDLDELYVYNPKAILPCFVVIYGL